MIPGPRIWYAVPKYVRLYYNLEYRATEIIVTKKKKRPNDLMDMGNWKRALQNRMMGEEQQNPPRFLPLNWVGDTFGSVCVRIGI